MERQPKDYTNALQKVFRELSYTKYKIIGSANLKAIRYPSDFDLNEEVKPKNISDFISRLKWIFTNAKSDKDFFITDFKAGEIQNEPIRWTMKDIMKGEKSGVELSDALLQDATVKLDAIILVDNKITEISTNFFINKKSGDVSELKKDLKELINEGMFFKALKRVFSIRKAKGLSVRRLEKYFNSDVGLANKAKSDLLTLVNLMEQKFRPVSLDIIRHNIQLIKYELSGVSKFNISSVFDEVTKMSDRNEIIRRLNQIADDILEIVNDDAERHFSALSSQ